MGIINNIDASIPQQLLESFMATHQHINESMYADEFNMDLAQAINELQHFCENGILEKTTLNNETCYVKASQLSFI
jgi:Fe2+ or Zn2+ uptake regulation protein